MWREEKYLDILTLTLNMIMITLTLNFVPRPKNHKVARLRGSQDNTVYLAITEFVLKVCTNYAVDMQN
jgi:hypothetical protein